MAGSWYGLLKAILYELQPTRYLDLVANVKSIRSNIEGITRLAQDSGKLLLSLSASTVLGVVAAIAGLKLSYHYLFAELYIIGMGTVLMFTNFSHRKKGDETLSAWSVFNDNFVSLLGTLRGEDLDREIRNQMDPIFNRNADDDDDDGDANVPAANDAEAGNNKNKTRKSNKKRRTEAKRLERLERQRLREMEDELLAGDDEFQ